MLLWCILNPGCRITERKILLHFSCLYSQKLPAVRSGYLRTFWRRPVEREKSAYA